MTLITVDTNAPQVFQALEKLINDIPKILEYEQGDISRAISAGLWDQFEILSQGDAIMDIAGLNEQWEPLSDATAAVRAAAGGVGPYSPILVVTGMMRNAVTAGSVIVSPEEGGSILTYFPAEGQAHKIDKHETGFTVTEKLVAGSGGYALEPTEGGTTLPRHMLFWGDALANAAVAGIERGLDKLIKARGF